MADVSWVKLNIDMFDNRKIKHLRKLPDGNNIVLIWVMLLTMAGRCNANGMIFLTENIPYTPKMLADELGFEENTVVLALEAMENFNMIVTDGGFFTIAGWQEYQNVEGLEKIREQNRIRQANFKQRKKLAQGNVTDNVLVTQGNATDIEEEKELDSDEDNKSTSTKKPKKHRHGVYQNVLLTDTEFENLGNSFGVDLRDKAITFLDEYIEEKGYKSKSHNLAIRRWVIDAVQKKDVNPNGRKEIVPKWCQSSSELSDLDLAAINRMMGKTAGTDPELAERAERLQRELKGE